MQTAKAIFILLLSLSAFAGWGKDDAIEIAIEAVMLMGKYQEDPGLSPTAKKNFKTLLENINTKPQLEMLRVFKTKLPSQLGKNIYGVLSFIIRTRNMFQVEFCSQAIDSLSPRFVESDLMGIILKIQTSRQKDAVTEVFKREDEFFDSELLKTKYEEALGISDQPKNCTDAIGKAS